MILHGLVHALPGMRAADHASGWPVGPAALAVARVWRPFGWWRGLATAGAGLSLVLLALFFGPTKLLPIFAALAILATGFGFWPAG